MNCKLWPLKLNNLQDEGNIFISSEIWSAAKSAVFHMTLLWPFVVQVCRSPSNIVLMFGKPFNMNIFDSTGWNQDRDWLEIVNVQYRLKISKPSTTFATRCKLRVSGLVEKSNGFANYFLRTRLAFVIQFWHL